jgi:hypothetical protein
MANTQRDGRNGRADAGCGPPDGAAPLEGVNRVPWRVDGAGLRRHEPAAAAPVRVEVLAASTGAADLDSGCYRGSSAGIPGRGGAGQTALSPRPCIDSKRSNRTGKSLASAG